MSVIHELIMHTRCRGGMEGRRRKGVGARTESWSIGSSLTSLPPTAVYPPYSLDLRTALLDPILFYFTALHFISLYFFSLNLFSLNFIFVFVSFCCVVFHLTTGSSSSSLPPTAAYHPSFFHFISFYFILFIYFPLSSVPFL